MAGTFRIDANTVYDDCALRLALGLTSATLTEARRQKQLRFVRKGKRTLYLGQWVLDWITADVSQKEEN